VVLCEQLQDTMKSRGKILSSTALALRQSITYGEAFAAALVRLVGPGLAPSTARAEALRFQARLACGDGLFSVDDVLAQDELLDRLELPMLQATVDPDELVAAVREERFARSNRFLLGLPRKLGRVRLAAVSDERIAEHVAAWCASRAV
jgi:3-dehydroquinate synthetase